MNNFDLEHSGVVADILLANCKKMHTLLILSGTNLLCPTQLQTQVCTQTGLPLQRVVTTTTTTTRTTTTILQSPITRHHVVGSVCNPFSSGKGVVTLFVHHLQRDSKFSHLILSTITSTSFTAWFPGLFSSRFMHEDFDQDGREDWETADHCNRHSPALNVENRCMRHSCTNHGHGHHAECDAHLNIAFLGATKGLKATMKWPRENVNKEVSTCFNHFSIYPYFPTHQRSHKSFHGQSPTWNLQPS